MDERHEEFLSERRFEIDVQCRTRGRRCERDIERNRRG